MTRVLVTGAAGFVGRHLIKECLSRGWDIVGIDPRPLTLEGVTFHQGDLTRREDVARAVRDVDYVFHEGAVSSSPMFEPDPSRGVEVNIMGGLNLLQASSQAGVGRFIYASTSSLYGDLQVPWNEGMAIPAVPNAYAASKLAFEYLAKLYATRNELQTVGLRYFSIYGPGEEQKGPFANMVSQFLWAVRKGEDPVVYGDGNQTRDFTHVKDVVRANFLAIEAKSVGEVFNVGTGKETTVNKVVESLADLFGNSIRPKHVPNPIPNYVYRTQADTSKAERLLGFKATVSFEEGLNGLVKGRRGL
jgi:UDP-glucose 4-epimerase